MWWGVNVASFQDPQDSSVMKDYFDTFCVKKDLEIENSHPSATCTDRLTLPLGPSLFQCRESRATGSGSTSPGFLFDNPLSELLVTSLSTPFVPAATQKNTHWSVGRFNDWMAHRNSLVSAESDRVPVGFLDRPDCVCNTSVLNKWLNLMALVRAQEIPTRLKQSTLSYVAYTDTYRVNLEWVFPTSFHEEILSSKSSMEPLIGTTGICELRTLELRRSMLNRSQKKA